MKYNILVVDDEFLARKLLTGYIEKMDNLNLVGCCSDAFEAINCIKSAQVDILLTDIHMPDLSGMDLAKMQANIPAIIFTTAYSEYAIESYELGATDYLLKPIVLPRFLKAIDKAIDQINSRKRIAGDVANAIDNNENDENGINKTNSLPASEIAATRPTTNNIASNSQEVKDFLMVKADYKFYKINYDELLYIEGQHEYVTFHTKTRRITALYSLKTLEEMLPKQQFMRVHKSFIISIRNITEIETGFVKIIDQKIPLGGSYRDELSARLMIK